MTRERPARWKGDAMIDHGSSLRLLLFCFYILLEEMNYAGYACPLGSTRRLVLFLSSLSCFPPPAKARLGELINSYSYR